ncbi:hypothetical protein MLD38_039889 [Melastoma candidum]|uniref:Uncharacterized protein n=1 Tax=Melastoma candidum TaxID=119954 RepID=A0ACB9L493_9MYRT|nr:hypothetical protein MLD38_039889 [Melastoma candidum]
MRSVTGAGFRGRAAVRNMEGPYYRHSSSLVIYSNYRSIPQTMETLSSESDWDSLSESSEEMELLYGGHAVSLLSNLEESIAKIDDFLSFERRFLLDDVVSSVSDPSGQMGKVVGLDISVDLESTKGTVITDVNSKGLFRIGSVCVGDYVIHKDWVGRIERVVDSVSVIFNDGTKGDFCPADPEKLVPVAANLVDESQYLYYPGQRIRVRLPAASRSAKWLCGSWKAGQEEGTVQSVKAVFLQVEWLASALVGHDVDSPTPPKVIKADGITLLSCFRHANWQLGDCCTVEADSKGMVGLDQTNRAVPEIYVIAKTKTKVNVLWQDGSCSFGVESQSLLPVNIVDAHEFWPEQFVMEKRSSEHIDCPISQKWGFVRAMDAKEKTVRVTWRNASAENTDPLITGWHEETVSAYELVEHPDYSFSLGDIVFKMMLDQVDRVETGEKPDRDLDNFYLSCIGNIVGFEDGSLEVKWANGFQEKVSPSEIMRVDKREVSDASLIPARENADQVDQQMAGHQIDFPETTYRKDDSISVSNYALGFLSGIASSLFAALGSSSMSTPKQYVPIFEDRHECLDPHDESSTEDCVPFMDTQQDDSQSIQGEAHATLKMEDPGNHLDKDIPYPSSSICAVHFKKFDMVTDSSDHHFFDNAGKGSDTSQVKRGWLKKIQQEWSILEKNLPENIYVRVYEERMDLLRAAIVGPSGTPYHDGLFFFDVFLPPDYPQEPPMVHYYSGGLRLNPNLYESGKVCLSLLNTWAGSGSEVWKPESSTILQVLVSLQALVLNDKPYFNEAGYDKQMGKTEGEKNSISYNENAFLLNCQSMLYILRKPPKHFEALVEEHFRIRCNYILQACKDYVKGAPVGFPSGIGRSESDLKGSSTGFKIMLAKLQIKLEKAFAEKGIICSQFQQP